MTLAVGDAAPPLAISEFLAGEPCFELVSGRVYIIEFWGVWCGPCVAAIPRLSALQAEFPHLTVLGVAERIPSVEKVREFAAGRAADFGYPVAIQAPAVGGDATQDRGRMSREWMDASFQVGVPCAFVVDGNGKIVRIAHPSKLDDAFLSEVVENRHDLAALASSYRVDSEKRKLRERFEMQAAVAAARRSSAPWGDLREFDRMAARHPDLERELGGQKLLVLVRRGDCESEARAYAEKLAGMAGDDLQSLLRIAFPLIEGDVVSPSGTAKVVVNPAYAMLGADLMMRAERLLSEDISASFRFSFYERLTKALWGAGRASQAHEKAEAAREWGKKAGVSAEALARLESMIGAIGP